MAKADLSKMDQEFVTKAAQDGMAEIEMAKLAQKKASSSEVREFAETMLRDHEDAKDKLSKVAKKVGIALPIDATAEHKKMLKEFAGYEGDEFDERFISVVMSEHKKDVTLYHSESEHGKNEDLKHLAAEIVPVLKKHVDMAHSLHGGG